MDGFQQTATEQHERVNGCHDPNSPQVTAEVRWKIPKGESVASDCDRGSDIQELTDLQELKAGQCDEEEEEEEREGSACLRGLDRDQQKGDKERLEQDGNSLSRQDNPTASTNYTGMATH